MEPNITIKGLYLKRSQQLLLENINLKIERGGAYALVGENGCGKTTLLKVLAGIIKPNFGTIKINDQNLTTLLGEKRALSISFLPQTNPTNNYCLGYNRIAQGLMPIYGFNYMPSERDAAPIFDIADKLSIRHLLNKPLCQMSGGEQRLIHIAKSMVNEKASIILLDEPNAFLDFSQKRRFSFILKKRVKQGHIIIFSSHEADFINSSSNCVLMIKNQNIHTYNSLKFCF